MKFKSNEEKEEEEEKKKIKHKQRVSRIISSGVDWDDLSYITCTDRDHYKLHKLAAKIAIVSMHGIDNDVNSRTTFRIPIVFFSWFIILSLQQWFYLLFHRTNDYGASHFLWKWECKLKRIEYDLEKKNRELKESHEKRRR